MSHGCSRYIRVYQDARHVRSVGGSAGQKLIKEFWNNQNPRSAIVKSLEVKGEITFPNVYMKLPYLVYTKGDKPNDTYYYTGLIYLVEIQKRSSKRRVKNIYIAEYCLGNLASMYHLVPTTRVWYDKNNLGFISVESFLNIDQKIMSVDDIKSQFLKIESKVINPTENV